MFAHRLSKDDLYTALSENLSELVTDTDALKLLSKSPKTAKNLHEGLEKWFGDGL